MKPIENSHLVIPSGARVYAFTDIHGHAAVAQQVYDLIDKDIAEYPPAHDQTLFVGTYGDMCDKGPYTRNVLDMMERRRSANNHKRRIRYFSLWGNHECNLYHFLSGSKSVFARSLDEHEGKLVLSSREEKRKSQRDIARYRWKTDSIDWLIHGNGLRTLDSYKIMSDEMQILFQAAKEDVTSQCSYEDLNRLRKKLKSAMSRRGHLDLLASQYASASYRHFFFVHAGVDPDSPVPLAQQPLTTKVGAKVKSARESAYQGMHLVHGHKSGAHAPRIGPFSIGIDAKVMRSEMGLVAVFEGSEVCFINTHDKKRTDPYLAAPMQPIVLPTNTESHPRKIEGIGLSRSRANGALI